MRSVLATDYPINQKSHGFCVVVRTTLSDISKAKKIYRQFNLELTGLILRPSQDETVRTTKL